MSFPVRNALVFTNSAVIQPGSFTCAALGRQTCLPTLAMAGLTFYVIVYTMLLKRRTWYNIVISWRCGLARFRRSSAIPAVTNHFRYAGLAAVRYHLHVWTDAFHGRSPCLSRTIMPVSGIPMLPVVRGDRATVISDRQIYLPDHRRDAASLLVRG